MRALALLIAAAACGDNLEPRDEMFTGVSGERLKLQWYLYQDGTQQPEPRAFYDIALHARCTRVEWSDGIARCTPIADPAIFTDADCTIERGREVKTAKPTYFIGYDRVDGKLRPARLLRAGARIEIDRPTTFYERRDGECMRIAEPPDTLFYYEIDGGDLGADAQVALWPEPRAIDDRLDLQLLVGSDGIASVTGFRDRLLDVDCRPQQLASGATACVPDERVPAAHFADVSCEEPLVVAVQPPRVVVVDDRYGCPSYHAVGDEHASLVFRRDGDRCVRYVRATDERAYRIGAPLPLVPFERAVETTERRRLQRITMRTGSTIVLDDRLFDLATRGECASVGNGELALCAPTSIAPAAKLFANAQCGLPVTIADVPRTQCTRATFAVTPDLSIHAIDKPYAGATLYTNDLSGICRPRPVPDDATPYVVGPALPLDTFVNGVVFSER